MTTPTYTLIDSEVLASAAASVTFTSIPADYRDLVLVVDAKLDGNGYVTYRLNGDTGSNYNYVFMRGTGSTTGSGSFTGTEIFVNINTSGTEILGVANLLDYSATDKHKSILQRGNMVSGEVSASAWRWADTSAVTSLSLTDVNANNFDAGSTFYLYGIEA
jgi:hypothetical protein